MPVSTPNLEIARCNLNLPPRFLEHLAQCEAFAAALQESLRKVDGVLSSEGGYGSLMELQGLARQVDRATRAFSQHLIGVALPSPTSTSFITIEAAERTVSAFSIERRLIFCAAVDLGASGRQFSAAEMACAVRGRFLCVASSQVSALLVSFAKSGLLEAVQSANPYGYYQLPRMLTSLGTADDIRSSLRLEAHVPPDLETKLWRRFLAIDPSERCSSYQDTRSRDIKGQLRIIARFPRRGLKSFLAPGLGSLREFGIIAKRSDEDDKLLYLTALGERLIGWIRKNESHYLKD